MRPILASDGEDDILCKPLSRRPLQPLGFGGCSKGSGSDSACVVGGVDVAGDSIT